METNEVGKVIEQTACPLCESSDAFTIYDKGNNHFDGYCYSCRSYVKDPFEDRLSDTATLKEQTSSLPKKYSTPSSPTKVTSIEEALCHPIRDIKDRGLHLKTCEHYGVRVGVDTRDGVTPVYHLYPTYKNGELSGFKQRICKDKSFVSIGDTQGVELFGSNVVKPTGKKLFITEGELDCLALYQVLTENSDINWDPSVVSLPHGVASASKSILRSIDLINGYEQIILVFDNDSPGKEATEEVCKLLAGKVYTTRITEKDPCDMVTRGKSIALKWAVLTGAKKYQPDGIVNGSECWERYKNEATLESFPYPSTMSGLNEKMYGIRPGSVITVTSGSGCVDKDTEFFTGYGWKKISDYLEGDKVLQYCNDGTANLVRPNDYVVYPCDKLTRIKTKYGLDMALCDDHRIVYKPEDSDKLKEILVKNVKDFTSFRGRIPTAFNERTVSNEVNISDLPYRLHVAVTADGHRHGRKIVFRVKKKRKVESLINLLTLSGMDYDIIKENNGYTVIRFTYLLEKGFPTEWYKLPGYLKKSIAKESLFWDGDQKKSYYTCKKEEADFIQYCFISTGTKATILVDNRPDKTLCYQVCTTERVNVGLRGCNAPEYFTPKDRKKYCFQVPSGMLVLRRNGKVFITGNCGKTQFLRELKYHYLMTTDFKIADIALEEDVGDTVGGLLSIQLNKRIMLPDVHVSEEEERKAFDKVYGSSRITLYDYFGGMDNDNLFSKLRYFTATGHKLIFLDHLSIIVSEYASEGGERERIDTIMTKLAKLVKETGAIIFLVVHLRKTDGKAFEEGTIPNVDDLRGSGSIKQLSWDIIGLSRNQQHKDPYCANTTEITVLKCRFTGRTGSAGFLYFDDTTGRMIQTDEPAGYRQRKFS